MKARLKLLPGQKGTKKLVDQYGDKLVCVRYRYDAVRNVRVKTIELIVETIEWMPPPAKYPDNAIVAVHIAYNEHGKQQLAKSAGGRWDSVAKLWRIPYGKVKGTLLEKHIIVDACDK